jgi:hypothetical protein
MNEFRVSVVAADQYAIDYGGCIHRADKLPQPGDEITVEIALTPNPSAVGQEIRVVVTDVRPEDDVPIHATQVMG